jgi:hypothetical protein
LGWTTWTCNGGEASLDDSADDGLQPQTTACAAKAPRMKASNGGLWFMRMDIKWFKNKRYLDSIDFFASQPLFDGVA